SDGSVQLSAGVMRGSDRAAGAVAALTRTEHPILAARFVLDSDQVLMAGEAADRRAAELGATQRENSFFVTERQWARLRGRAHELARGTVGAVCLDVRGALAAATSTGGRSGQPPGRVGDSPLIGAGTWADERVAISCTGAGEAFIRAGAARQIAMLLQSGMALEDATERALADVAALGGRGGLIALDSTGAMSTPLLRGVMPGGSWRAGSEPAVWVTEPPGFPGIAQ
ncbi:MAG TPA: isoaspartyl peptidase/L-asparaginase, partial [Solirubrobacteraceae bacterium]